MNITKKEKCTGCALCAYVCPKEAITLEETNDLGFVYPSILADKCIGCNKCISSCVQNNPCQKNTPVEYVIAQNNNIEELKLSTSGGIASAISKCFIREGGVVYGAAFDENMQVAHIRVITEKDCELIKGSKYVQSDISQIYTSVYEDLKKQVPVLFIGTPCQCASMKKAFEKYKQFYCCDFICNGVGSPSVFRKHIAYLNSSYNCNINKYVFRPKVGGYLEPYEQFYDINGKTYRIKSPWKKWGTLYYGGLVMRESCYQCGYTSTDRVGNCTFSDIPSSYLEINDLNLLHNIKKHGASYISINDEKGRYLLTLTLDEVSFQNAAFISKVRMHTPMTKHHEREVFRKEFNKSFNKAKNKTLGFKLKLKGIVIEKVDYLKNK